MSLSGERFSNAVIERIRTDFARAVRTSGINITYMQMDSIVSWGSGVSGVSGVEEDPVYSQPAYPLSSLDEGKTYTNYNIMAIVDFNPTIYKLKKLGLNKDSQIMATVAALTLEESSIEPRPEYDRLLIDSEEFDIISQSKSHLTEGESGENKNFVWVFGGIRRSGRV